MPPESTGLTGVQLHVEATLTGLDARRGLVRLAPSILRALDAKPYSVVKITGKRTTAALVAPSTDAQDPTSLLVDDLVLGNLGVGAGTTVTVEPAPSLAADHLVISAPAAVSSILPAQTVRLALLGKVISQGDSVSLLQQDLALPEGCTVDLLTQGRQQMQAVMGQAWQGTVVSVVSAPAVPTVVTMSTDIQWDNVPTDAAATAAAAPAAVAGSVVVPTAQPTVACHLPGAEEQIRQTRELLDVGLNHPQLLSQLGSSPSLGVLLTGPAGCGKSTLVRRLAADLHLTVRSVWAPTIASLVPDKGFEQLVALRKAALADSGAHEVLVIDDIEALVPRDGDAPLAAAVIELVGQVVVAGRAIVALSAAPELVSPHLLAPSLLSHQVVIGLPDDGDRRALLAALVQPVALDADVVLDDIATHTPGFVAADLAALVNGAAQQAAQRAHATPTAKATVTAADFAAALQQVHPSSMDGQLLDPGKVSLSDIGGLGEVKQVLTESVIWPITYPDTFARLGVAPTRGLLLYGPPGCGKTYLVKALAHDGRANVLSVKGSELMSKWVGESEAGVRQLFARARGAAPSLVFLDEVDALAPVRGGGEDPSGDRVVAALLTELDGINELNGVVVVGATNRPDMVDPALLRPGRLERLLFVPPPDEAARAEIFRAASAHTPLAPDVDLAAIARESVGFSGADCSALIRQAALAAMRRSMDAPCVTMDDITSALTVVHPSLDATQVARLANYAAERASR